MIEGLIIGKKYPLQFETNIIGQEVVILQYNKNTSKNIGVKTAKNGSIIEDKSKLERHLEIKVFQDGKAIVNYYSHDFEERKSYIGSSVFDSGKKSYECILTFEENEFVLKPVDKMINNLNKVEVINEVEISPLTKRNASIESSISKKKSRKDVS